VHFISALATTDSKFLLQLWDQLTNQVKTTLKMLHPSHIDPSMSAYKAIHGPYEWNRFPLAPPGCKAIIYNAPETCGLWASCGADAWYIGPWMDHYHTGATTILSPKRAPTVSQVWQKSSCSIVKSHSSCGMNTYKKL
jgi:hypothetical protein